MTTVMLVVYLLSGQLHVDRYRAKDMEQCIAAMPAMSKKLLDTASIVCVNVSSTNRI